MPPKKSKSAEEIQVLKKEIERLKQEVRVQLGDTEAAVQPLQQVARSGNLPLQKTSIRRRRILKGHFGKVYACQWSDADSRHFVSAAQDGKLLVWNAFSTNKELAVNLPSGYVMTCAYSPSGAMVACGGLDNVCSVFKVPVDQTGVVMEANRNIAVLQQHEGYLSCCRFVSDSEMLTSSGDSTCILWDIERRQPKVVFNDHNGDVMTISISPSGWFVSGSCDNTAKLWDHRAQESRSIQTFSGHTEDVNAVACTPDGVTFATGSDDTTCRLFDIRACRQLNKYSGDAAQNSCVTSISFSKSGKILFAGYDSNATHGWDSMRGEIIHTLSGHDNRVSCVHVNKTGDAIASGSWDTLLYVWA